MSRVSGQNPVDVPQFMTSKGGIHEDPSSPCSREGCVWGMLAALEPAPQSLTSRVYLRSVWNVLRKSHDISVVAVDIGSKAVCREIYSQRGPVGTFNYWKRLFSFYVDKRVNDFDLCQYFDLV